MKFHGEALLTNFRMLSERTVCEAESFAAAVISDHVHNPAGV